MTSNLSVTKVGVYKLVVGRGSYVCSAFSVTMTINQIPVASCVVGCGRNILGNTKFDNNAEDLYNELQSIEMSNSTELVPCSVFEELDGRDYLVFKGVIVGASLVYKTGSATIRAVRFEMMYSACNLMAQPLTAYKNICGSQIVKMLLSGKMLTNQQAAEQQGMARMGQLASMLIVGKLKEMIQEKDMATRIACLCDAFVVLNSYTYNLVDPQTAGIGSLLRIKDYIRSSYSLDKKKLDLANTTTDNRFNVQLCDALTQGLQSGSIYDAITRAILSPEFLLAIIPRFSDGMMEIKPSSAWGTNDTVYQLPLSAVAYMNSAFHPLDQRLKDVLPQIAAVALAGLNHIALTERLFGFGVALNLRFAYIVIDAEQPVERLKQTGIEVVTFQRQRHIQTVGANADVGFHVGGRAGQRGTQHSAERAKRRRQRIIERLRVSCVELPGVLRIGFPLFHLGHKCF